MYARRVMLFSLRLNDKPDDFADEIDYKTEESYSD